MKAGALPGSRGAVCVLHVIEATEGGTRRWLENALCGLDPARVANSCIYAARRDASFRDSIASFRQHGIDVWEVDMTRAPHPCCDAIAIAQIMAILSKHPFDVMHAHSSKAGVLARIAACRAKQRPVVVYSPHAFSFLNRSVVAPVYRAVEKALCARTDYLMAVSQSERDLALSIGYNADRVRVIANGVEVPPSRVLRRRGAPHVGFIGYLRHQKDPLTFAAACRIVHAARPDARFTLCGDGPMLRQCRDLVADLGMNGSVTFTGWVEEARRLTSGLDAFVSCALYEGLSYALLDAMGAGVPVVATRAPGNEEVVMHEHTGLLVSCGDPAATAGAILRIIEDGAFAAAMGERGRRHVIENYTLEVQLDRLTKFYRGIVAERRLP